MKLPHIILFCLLLFLPRDTFGQGGWDIGYIPVDSISVKQIGKDLKLDFRAACDTTTKIPKFLMGFIGKQDTIKISIDNEIIELIERRAIYDDWGFYNEQFLESPDYGPYQVLRVYHSIIEEVQTDSILVRLYLELYNKSKGGKISDTPRRFSESIWIPKTKLNGFMVKHKSLQHLKC